VALMTNGVPLRLSDAGVAVPHTIAPADPWAVAAAADGAYLADPGDVAIAAPRLGWEATEGRRVAGTERWATGCANWRPTQLGGPDLTATAELGYRGSARILLDRWARFNTGLFRAGRTARTQHQRGKEQQRWCMAGGPRKTRRRCVCIVHKASSRSVTISSSAPNIQCDMGSRVRGRTTYLALTETYAATSIVRTTRPEEPRDEANH